MKTTSAKSLCLALLLGFSATTSILAAENSAPPPASPPAATLAEKARADLLLPGVSLAEGVSEITGVAISPLLGMSAMGAWTYYRTEPALRHRLPWYCHPYVWSTGLALIGVCLLKDLFGATAPALVKKPLDFAELFEDKASALVASVGFVPLVALAIAQVEKLHPQATQAMETAAAASGLATMPLASILEFSAHTPWISIPVAILAFGVVWLSSHAINVLIALSPFGLVDAGLKLTKLALITLVTVSAAIHPWLGATVSGVLIIIGILIAGWSYRLTLFGTLMGRDLLLMKRAQKTDLDQGVKGFLARRTQGIPVRTYGALQSDPATGATFFAWRPWIVLPRRRITVPAEGIVICKGLLHPSVAHRDPADLKPRNAIILLPRYRRLEEEIAPRFGCQEVMDSALMRGFKAARRWLFDILSTGRKLIEPPAPAKFLP